MGNAIDSICEFNDTNAVIGILVVRKLGMLDRLTKSIDFVDLLLAVGTAVGNSGEPTCGVDLVYADVCE